MAATASAACSGQLSQSAALVRSRSHDAGTSFLGTSLPKPVLGRSCSQRLQRAGLKVNAVADIQKAPSSHKLIGKEASSAALQQLRISGAANRECQTGLLLCRQVSG
jgi:hypothetical protein